MIFHCLDGEGLNMREDEPGQGCYAISLHLRDQEGLRERHVSQLLLQLWNSMECTDYEEIRNMPVTLSEHLNLKSRAINVIDLYSILCNHIKTESSGEIFICALEIPTNTISKEFHNISMDHIREMRIFANTTNLAFQRLEMCERKRIYPFSLTRIRPSRPKRRPDIILENPNFKQEEPEMIIPEKMIIPDHINEALTEFDQILLSIPESQILDRDQQAEMERSVGQEEPFFLNDQQTLSQHVNSLLNKDQLDVLNTEISKAVEAINIRLADQREKNQQDEDFSPSAPLILSVDKIVENTEVGVDQKPNVSDTPAPNLPFPTKENWLNIADEIIRREKLTPTNYSKLGQIILEFPNSTITLVSEIHESMKKKKFISEHAKQFFNKNKIKFLFHNYVQEMQKEMEENFISVGDISYEELEHYCSPDLFVEIQTEADHYRIGPSVTTITREKFSGDTLRRYAAVIIGNTELFRELYTCKKQYIYDEMLNMSSPRPLKYSDSIISNNTLYDYLRQVIGQIESSKKPLPLYVEFIQRVDNTPIEKQVKDFMHTLAIAQDFYQGLIIAIAPPPFWQINMSLPSYIVQKRHSRKTAEIMVAIGMVLDIYVSVPFLCSIPIINDRIPTHYGFIIDSTFRRLPIISKEGSFTEEAFKRAARSIRRDLKLMRKLKIID